ncbi:MAG TPA: GatB/YqeY domain-containing protein [Dehalococcoidia bacterium]|nr:GatB/YqeY domain-containing protein [Dehalococcoidia bacterium]
MEPGLKEKLETELKQALRAKDAIRLSVIRLALAAIKNAEIARRAALDDSDILGVIAKEARQRQESIEAFKQGNRPDLVAREEAELAILQEYLPAPATREEIMAEARRLIAEVGAQGPRDKGKVIPQLIAKFKGKAEGKEINAAVTELLGS